MALLRTIVAVALALLAGAAWGAEEQLEHVSGPIVVHHGPAHAELARTLGSRGAVDMARIGAALGLDPPARLDVYLIPRGGDSEPSDWNVPPGPEWAAGLALTSRPVVILRTAEDSGREGNVVATVLTHEIVHAVASSALGERHDLLPAWMIEGSASHLAYEWRLVHGAHAAGFAMTGRYVPLAELARGFPPEGPGVRLAYLESFSFVNWLARRHGEDSLRRYFQAFAAGSDAHDAFVLAFGATPRQREGEWKRGFLLWHRWLPALMSSSTLWFLIVALVVAGGVRKRRRTSRTLASWDEQERREDAAAFPEGRPLEHEDPSGDEK